MRWQWLTRFATRARTVAIFVWSLLCLFAAAAVDAEPMNLGNEQARWIGVRFEVSPHARPGQRDTIYTQTFPAWIEPAEEAGQLRVTVAARIVEQHLMGDQVPVPGSFSDFVWIFDTQSGAVLSASLRGKLVTEISWGLLSTQVHSDIDVQMDSAQHAGYEMPRQVLHHRVFPYCAAGRQDSEDCTLVTPSHYEAGSGYVNAVGELTVASSIVTLHTFSPLGEAVFSELPAWPDYAVEVTRPAARAHSMEVPVAGKPTLLGEAQPF